MRAAGGIQHHHVVALEPRGLFGALERSAPGVWPGTIGSVSMPTWRPSTASCSCAAGRFTSSDAISTRFFLAFEQPFGDLRRRRRLNRRPGGRHHDGDGRGGVEIDRLGMVAQGLDQHVVDDLDDHLAGRDRLDDIGADRLNLHLVDERAHDIQVDVGFQKRTNAPRAERC